MANDKQLDRIAAVLNILRPEWPISSCKTLLEKDHSRRPYADLAIAAVAVAVDPRSATPKRLAELGPWWRAAQAANGHDQTPGVGPGSNPRCTKEGHEYY